MFDKQKIIAMTAALEEFVRVHPNIFILPEVLGGNVLYLLKRLKANVAGIMTNAPVKPEQNIIQTPSGNYPLVNFSIAIPSFDYRTGVIISYAKPMPNPNFFPTFSIGEIKISIPAFALTDEEALAIYDRLTTMNLIKQYYEDLGPIGIEEISVRFARGMSTFIDSRYQDMKVQIWDRRNFKTPSYDVDDAAIVMQGPLEYNDNYTITTAKLYREWYPNTPIIISTWKNEATEVFREECKKINVVLLENDLPAEPGLHHVNYQLESSFKGVEYVKKYMSSKFALKCRTDQRLNRTDFLIYFKNLLKMFPPNGNKLNERILLGNASRWIPFFGGDFFYFGTVEDTYKLFNIPLQTKLESNYYHRIAHHLQPLLGKLLPFAHFRVQGIKYDRKFRNYSKMMFKLHNPEAFILRNFYHKYIEPIVPEKLLKIYWRFLKDYMVIANQSDLLLNWPKYHNKYSYDINIYYDISRDAMDHARWLDIYLNYKDEDE